jgi:hypothetical protein
LERSFPPDAGETEPVEAKPSAKKLFALSVAVRRFAKIALGIALVVVFGWAPLRAMLATTSVGAIVNARIETIRSPIGGLVQAPAGKNVNWASAAAPPKLVVDPLRERRSERDSSLKPLGST